MSTKGAILLFVDDRPVLSSLQFSLGVEGFDIADGAAEGFNPAAAGAFVIDQRYAGDGLATLARLRAKGCGAPAIILATNPTQRFRSRVAVCDAKLVEKPLLGDELGRAIHTALETRLAA